MISPHIFRAYDIRGKAATEITQAVADKVAQAFGTVLRERYDTEHPKVIVGQDARLSSPMLEQAVVEGLMRSGCRVLRMGQTPSPINYFMICTEHLDGGIQITASHNPAEDNGLKLQLRGAEAYSGEDLQDLRKRIETGVLLEGEGSQETVDATGAYLRWLEKRFGDAAMGLSIVVDSGNGVAGPAYTDMLSRAGAKVTALCLEPDGSFPNHPADPSRHDTLALLQQTVRKEGAHMGIAFDGDGDRMGIVDEEGNIRTPDEVLLLLAEDLLTRHAGVSVVFTVSNSGILETEIERMGGKPVMCRVGHSFVEHAMREEGALLGGEQSGHFFPAEDYFGFDDALVAALRFARIVCGKRRPVSAILGEYPRVFQAHERRPFCPDDLKSLIVAKVTAHFAASYPVNTLDGARIDFGEGAWAGIRQSNTSPKLSIVLEARSREKLDAIEKIVMEELGKYPEVDFSK